MILTIIFISLMLTGCTQEVAGEKKPTTETEIGSIDEAIESQIQRLVDDGGFPSLSAGIILDDELIWAKNYNGPSGLDSVYIVGSIQKPFTASAVLKLAERDLLDIDEEVGAYLPFSVIHPQYPDTPITLRMLLTHRSGLGDVSQSQDLYRYEGDYTVQEFGEKILGIDFPRLDPYPEEKEGFWRDLLTPGGIYYSPDVWEAELGAFSYSNIGYDLLGYVVENVSGQPFVDYLTEQILAPLGMTRSGYRVSDLSEFHATPYERIEDGALQMEGEMVPILEEFQGLVKDNLLELPLYEHHPGAGGMRTTVPDLAKFLIAQSNQGQATNGFQLLRPETVEMMHDIAAPAQGNINSFTLAGQGMGWSLCEDGVEGHVGGQLGFGATMVFKETPKGTVGVLLMTNHSAMFLEDDARFDWFNRFYFPLEQLLLQAGGNLLDAA
jgi:CubicO group peptidase (beta-lactamase class C family)